MMDKMSGIMIQNNKNIDQSGKVIDEIRTILHGQEDDDDNKDIHHSRISDDEKEHGALPDLYSLRRSPFYQIKIVQKQFNAAILNTRNDHIKKCTELAKKTYDMKDCLIEKEEEDPMMVKYKTFAPSLNI